MKDRDVKKVKQQDPEAVDMEIQGVEITLVFAKEDNAGLRERIVDILTDAYEKKRLG